MKQNLGIRKPALAAPVDSALGCRLHPDLKEYLGYCFYKAAAHIRAKVDARLEPFGVLAPQFGMLIILKSQGSMSQNELASFMAMDKATMVRMIDGLQEKALLTRVPSKIDRRANLLAITAEGRVSLARMNQARALAEREFLRALTPTERVQLKSIVGKLIS